MDVTVCPVTDRVVVADQDNKRVQVFDAGLKHIMNIEKDRNGEELKCPRGVAVNHDGEIIVSDGGANTVSVYHQNGFYSRQLPGPWDSPSGIVVDINDDVYVCCAESIKVINQFGEIVRTIDRRDTGPGASLDQPCFIAVYKNHILVSDRGGDIHQFTKGGSYVKKLDVVGVHIAAGLAVTANQDILVVDGEGAICVLAEDETVSGIGEHGLMPWQLFNAAGIAVTRSGQIIAANSSKNNLLIYDQVKKFYIK